MAHYVAGFCFRTNDKGAYHSPNEVLLIRKQRPEYMVNMWNGIGGGVERGENALHAIIRETQEESGLVTYSDDWFHYVTLNTTRGDRIDFFFCMYDSEMGDVEQKESEVVKWIPLAWIEQDVHLAKLGHKIVWEFIPYPNLHYLIPLAIDHIKGKAVHKHVTIVES